MSKNANSQKTFVRFWSMMLHRYVQHNVGIAAAALAFFLLFMIFPFLIFISALLGFLHLDVAAILRSLDQFLPVAVVDVAETYLNYVASNPSEELLIFGLVFSIYFPMRATNSLMQSVRAAYRLGLSKNALRHWARVLIYTVLLIVTIALTAALMTVGERVLRYLVASVGLPAWAVRLWIRLRFPAAAVVGWLALFVLYAFAQDSPQPIRNLWPGALAALAAWLGLSWGYAYYVNHLARYSLFYGSIGTIVVLLIWLDWSAITLIMGAEMNGVLINLRKERLGQVELADEEA